LPAASCPKTDLNWRPSRWQHVAIVEFIDVYEVYPT
jgi:hypothetical protein